MGLTELVVFLLFCSPVPKQSLCFAYFFNLTPPQEFQKAD